jgi:hypothetical protein
MSRRVLLALAAALTAFALLLAGGVAAYALRPAPTAARASDTVPVDVVRKREAEYRRLLDEANARLRAQPAAVTAAIAAPSVDTAPAPAPVAEPTAEPRERQRASGDDDDHHARSRHAGRRSAHREDDDG